MQYTEEYVIEYVRYDKTYRRDVTGTFGPYLTEEEGQSMMRTIEKRHNHVRDIHRAELYRVSRVGLGSLSRPRETP